MPPSQPSMTMSPNVPTKAAAKAMRTPSTARKASAVVPMMPSSSGVNMAAISDLPPLGTPERVFDLGLGHFLRPVDRRHADGLQIGVEGEPKISDELHEQPDPQRGQRDR